MATSTTPSSPDMLIAEARQRGIDVVNFPAINPDFIMFEHDDHREPLYYSRTNHHGAITVKIFDNKMLTTAHLRRAGFPVPDEILTSSLKEAEAFLHKHSRVVVKPLGNTGGKGITTNVRTKAALKRAFTRARDNSIVKDDRRPAIIQKHIEGRDFRILVINQEHTFVIERIAAHVIGDGKRTVKQLVAAWNKTRKPSCRVKINDAAHEILRDQKVKLGDTPAKGQHVRLAGVANYHAGGSLRDATDELSPAMRKMALAVAQYFDVPIIGVDVLSPDISTDDGYIIELNATPDITIHHFPDEGESHDIARLVIDFLFPETAA